MDHRIGGVNEPVVAVPVESELRPGNVAAKNSYARLQVFVEPRKLHVQLQRSP